MAILPVIFETAVPVQAVDSVGRVKRRPKSESKSRAVAAKGPATTAMRAPLPPEEWASDATREALDGLRLGG